MGVKSTCLFVNDASLFFIIFLIFIRALVKSAYQKVFFLFQKKLKRTVPMRRFFWALKAYV